MRRAATRPRRQPGGAVRLGGRRREHGEHLAFVDLRDYSGTIAVRGGRDASTSAASGWCSVEGTVRLRPEGTVNPELPTGEVELTDCVGRGPSEAEPPPFPVDDRAETDESVRLRYRFVDLRRPRMQRNLRLRARVLGAMRAAMVRQGFCEVETPLLWTPTPEGAREFAVPSRFNRGKFYVLPQSPQIAKQLLMVAGIDRYFQIARCLRDEDLRADRQFEFTQLDIEASFVTESDVQDGHHRGGRRSHRGRRGRGAVGHRDHDVARGHGPLRRRQARPALRDGARRPRRGVRRHRGAGLRRAVREGGAGARRRRARSEPARRPRGPGQGARGQGPGLVQGDLRLRRPPSPPRSTRCWPTPSGPAFVAAHRGGGGGPRPGGRRRVAARLRGARPGAARPRPAPGGPGRAPVLVGDRIPPLRRHRRGRQPPGRPSPLHHAAPRRPRPARH